MFNGFLNFSKVFFHELMYLGVPTIFLPNEKTITDDQVARARRAENAGAVIMVRDSIGKKEMKKLLADATHRALDVRNKKWCYEHCEKADMLTQHI